MVVRVNVTAKKTSQRDRAFLSTLLEVGARPAIREDGGPMGAGGFDPRVADIIIGVGISRRVERCKSLAEHDDDLN